MRRPSQRFIAAFIVILLMSCWLYFSQVTLTKTRKIQPEENKDKKISSEENKDKKISLNTSAGIKLPDKNVNLNMLKEFELRHRLVPPNNTCRSIQRLKKIVLAVNFNFPHYAAVPFLKPYYEPVFGKVIFCGQDEDKEHGVIKISENKGYQGYLCVTMAIKLYPDYDGYIHTNDDVLINWWNLLKLNDSQIWTSSLLNLHRAYEFGKPVPKNDWYWWNDQNTPAACEAAFREVKGLISKAENLSFSGELYLTRYYKNTKNKDLCINGFSDVFYIPKEHAPAFQAFAEIFGNKKVFLEAAVSTIIAFLVNDTNFIQLPGVYLNNAYGYSKTYLSGEAFYESYTVDLYVLHPFKLDGAMKKANRNMFNEVVVKHGENYRKGC